MGFLQGKKILITGIVSNRSIAYGIAKCCHREGAELAFSYANERFKDRVAGFAADFGSDFVLQMDVSNDEQINNTFAQIKQRWGALDGLVHSIGFAPREVIAGDFLEGCTRDAFKNRNGYFRLLIPRYCASCHASHGRPCRLPFNAHLLGR